jgi:hypothetical protein
MNQKGNNQRSNVKNPLSHEFKDAANNRSAQKDPKSEKFAGSEQKEQRGSVGDQAVGTKESK